MEYTPTSTNVRDQWNKFIKFLREKKISGSKDLDHGANPTKKLLDQYRAVDPEFTIQPKDVGNIQFEMSQFKKTGEFPGYNPDAQKAIQTAYKKYADTKQFSKQDGWIGSQTSQQFFPSAKTTLAVTNPQGVTKTQSQDYGSKMDDFAAGKGINWNEKSKSQGTQTTIVGTEGMDINKIPTPPNLQSQAAGEIQKGIPINGRKVKLGSQILGTYNNGVFVPAGGLTGNAARITGNPATLNEYLISNGYAQGETKISNSFRRGGTVKYAEGGTNPYGGYFDQRTDAPSTGTQVPNAPTNNFEEFPQQPPTPPTEEPKKTTSWGRKAWNTVGAVSDGVQNLIDIGGAAVNHFDQQNKQKEFDAAQRAKMNTDGLFGPGATGTSKGDYVQNGSAYGMFQPNKQGNFTGKGMSQGPYYPGFAMGGTLVPEGLNDPGRTYNTSMTFNKPPTTTVDMVQAKEEVNPINPTSAPSDLKEFIIAKESSGNYKALPKDKKGNLVSSAVGAYQFLWKAHNSWITKVTGVKSKEEFMNKPEAQDKAFDYWNETVLTPEAKKIAAMINNPNITLDAIKAQIHFSGVGGARDYFLKGKKTTDAFGTTNNSYATNNPTKKYQVGGEYEMTEKELLEYMKCGGKVDFI